MGCAILSVAPPQRCPDSRPAIGHLIFFAFFGKESLDSYGFVDVLGMPVFMIADEV